MAENAQCQQIKEKIVETYRRGVCDKNGDTIPREHRGMAGKGSHFRPPKTKAWYDNFDLIDWSH